MIFLNKTAVLAFEFPITILFVEGLTAAVSDTNKISLIEARF